VMFILQLTLGMSLKGDLALHISCLSVLFLFLFSSTLEQGSFAISAMAYLIDENTL
jgi:hypothetical protein